MAGRIPEQVLEDILSRVDIVEIISSHLPLKKAGRNFKTTCPFHHEKTPSFMVSPDRQIFHCFGCGESGNAFKFLMKYERMEFLEAVEHLAKKAGVNLPQLKKEDAGTISLTTQLFRVNELAASFYEQSQTPHTREYLLKRGIKEETIKAFKLGFAPDKWDALILKMRSQGVSLSVLEKAGLIVPKENGGYYDRFRNRIIFPILDIKARPVGFGARVTDNSLPKYINSPETPVYVKGRNLYGLHLAKDAIRERDFCVVTEGYLDFMMPYQEGLRNIVASLGTALTVEQARLLKRYTHNVVMVYDADTAGELATLRSLDIFIEEEMQVKVASLPKGFDPDSFVRKYGIESFKAQVESASSLFDYKLRILRSRFNAGQIEGKAKISQQMLETISKFKNAVLRSEYLKRLSQELDVKEEALFQEINKFNKDSSGSAFAAEKPVAKKALPVNPAEKLLIRLMLEESALISHIRQHLEPADFQDERASRIVSVMFDLMEQGKEVQANHLVHHFQEDEVSQLVCESMFIDEVTLEHDREKLVSDCIRRLKADKAKLKRKHLHDQIRDAQQLGDEERLQSLIEEFHHLIKKG